MLHSKTKRLEICFNTNTEINSVDHYTGTITSRIFRLALEIGNFFPANGLRVTLTKEKT